MPYPFTEYRNRISASTLSPSVTATSRMLSPKRAIFKCKASCHAQAARLQIASFKLTTGTVITRGMTSFGVQFHVSDTCGQPVSGALLYVTGVPYNQLSTPAETATDAAGNVTLTFNRKVGFPASNKQSLLVLFARARKSGDPLLAGISTRRLVSLRVNLHQQ